MVQRHRLQRWMRVGVSAAITAVLLALIPVRDLRIALARVSTGVFVSSLLIVVGGHIAAALKWRLLQGNNSGLSTITVLRAHFFGQVASLWLPGVVGGDLVRVGSTFRHSTRPALVAVASLVDRIVDSVVLILLAVGGLVLVGAPSQNARQMLGVVAAIIAVGGAALAGAYGYIKARFRTNKRIAAVVEAVDLIVQRPGLVGLALLISVGIQVVFVIVSVNLGRAVGMTAPVSAWFLVFPLAKLAALIPISVAGFGVREAALVRLMRPFGDDPSTVMAAGLLWQALFVAGGTFGWAALSLIPDVPSAGHQQLRSSDS
jgi:glycosyltransferase 2 family protein